MLKTEHANTHTVTQNRREDFACVSRPKGADTISVLREVDPSVVDQRVCFSPSSQAATTRLTVRIRCEGEIGNRIISKFFGIMKLAQDFFKSKVCDPE